MSGEKCKQCREILFGSLYLLLVQPSKKVIYEFKLCTAQHHYVHWTEPQLSVSRQSSTASTNITIYLFSLGYNNFLPFFLFLPSPCHGQQAEEASIHSAIHQIILREKKAHTQDEMNSLFFFLSQSFELCALTDTRFPSTVVSVRSHPHHSTFFFRSPAFPAFPPPLSLSLYLGGHIKTSN